MSRNNFLLIKAPQQKSFFLQKPLSKVETDLQLWYSSKKIGHNIIGNFMRKICAIFKIEIAYTNHSIRATTCIILGQKGFSDINIVGISGHSSLSSLAYYKKPQESVKLKMSDSLAQFSELI